MQLKTAAKLRDQCAAIEKTGKAGKETMFSVDHRVLLKKTQDLIVKAEETMCVPLFALTLLGRRGSGVARGVAGGGGVFCGRLVELPF